MEDDGRSTKHYLSWVQRSRGIEMEDDGRGAVAVHVGEKMAPALISAHPQGAALVVAIGSCLRIFDFMKASAVSLGDSTTPGRHGEAIRAMAFNREGSLFASAGDDKLVKLWDASSWRCIKTTRLAKKVTGVSFTQDSKWLLFADKFGVVFVLPTAVVGETDEPAQLLAHCCSIITDLKLSPDGKYVVTSDRDFKIRVSTFPAHPTNGAHEIWSYCLGHTSFVTCVAFVGESPQHLLVSGGGDATVRLWNYEVGELLDVFDTSDVTEVSKDDESGKEISRAVIGISVSPLSSVVAVIVERYAGVVLLEYDMKKLKYLQSVVLPEQVSPTSLSFDNSGRLWVVAGAAEFVDSSDRSLTPEEAAAAELRAHTIAETAVTHVRLMTRSSSAPTTLDAEDGRAGGEKGEESYSLCEDTGCMPGGEMLLRTLQGNKVDATEVAVAAGAAEIAMRKLMTKREYTIEQRENRKRTRNDRKLENKRV